MNTEVTPEEARQLFEVRSQPLPRPPIKDR
jgi:hypothetical protein